MMLTPTLGITSVICFSLPVLAILYFKLYRHTSLIALIAYYVLTILRCVESTSIPPKPDFNNDWDVLYNYIEIPLMLMSLLFFCPARHRQQKVHFIIGGVVAYELVVAIVFGVTPVASLYLMAPGLMIIVIYSLFLFLRQLKFTLLHGKNAGRVLMLGSLLFSYSCYLFMFYAYFIQGQKEIGSIYSVHFISASIAAVLMSVGLLMMRHRIRELQDLKVTRRELQLYYGS